MVIFDTNRLMKMHFQFKMIIYDLENSRKKINIFVMRDQKVMRAGIRNKEIVLCGLNS